MKLPVYIYSGNQNVLKGKLSMFAYQESGRSTYRQGTLLSDH